MNIYTFHIISTVLVSIVFIGVCCWAFSPDLKKRFEQDANLPFADDPMKNKQGNNKAEAEHTFSLLA